MNLKGQYFSFDAIIASIIFILAFTTLLNYWFSMKSMLETKDEEISKEAARISDVLLSPAILATSYSDRRINQSTLGSKLRISEEALKNLTNSPYNISINISSAGLFFGGAPPVTAKNIAKVRRIIVIYNATDEQLATFDLYLYN